MSSHRNPNKIPAIDPQFPNNVSDIKRILRNMTTQSQTVICDHKLHIIVLPNPNSKQTSHIVPWSSICSLTPQSTLTLCWHIVWCSAPLDSRWTYRQKRLEITESLRTYSSPPQNVQTSSKNLESGRDTGRTGNSTFPLESLSPSWLWSAQRNLLIRLVIQQWVPVSRYRWERRKVHLTLGGVARLESHGTILP